MMKHINQKYEVIVVGGGQAGLAISYYLKQENINHIVLERKQIANSWISQRWDSFTLNTPNWMNVLPGMISSPNEDKDAFKTNSEFIESLLQYVEINDLPVLEEHEVTAIQLNNSLYRITIKHRDNIFDITSEQIVIATGQMSDFKNPTFNFPIPNHIKQINAAEYKNPSEIIGNVLIVGSGQSGVQIAEELTDATYPKKDNIYLATSKVPRSPRRYRGKDIMEWQSIIGSMDQRTDELEDLNICKQTQPQVSGRGLYGHTISLQSLNRQGTIIVGKLLTTTKNGFEFSNDVKQNIAFADGSSEKLKAMVDSYLILTNQIELHQNIEIDEADIYDSDFYSASDITQLNFNQIDTVIWAIGYRAHFDYIKIKDALNKEELPIHINGIAPIRGLYYLGFPWLIKRKSGIIFGIAEDAEAIKNQLLKHRKRN